MVLARAAVGMRGRLKVLKNLPGLTHWLFMRLHDEGTSRYDTDESMLCIVLIGIMYMDRSGQSMH